MKKISTFMIIAVASILVACEGSRTARMIDTVEGAVDDYNNGDSSTLIILIIFAIILGGLWLYSKKDKW